MNNDKIEVSVVVTCYNQENYIKKAIESILMQKTEFAFEILIGDDASTDHTADIVADYAKKYPNMITAFLRQENLKPTRNFYELAVSAKGEFIALLEGDDYWIDSNKLQKQYNVLAENGNYIGCTHRIMYVDQNDKKLEQESSLYQFEEQTYTLDTFLNNSKTLPGHTGTMFFRNFFKNKSYDWKILYKAHDFMGDVTLNFMLLTQGDIACMPDIMSAFRVVVKEGESNWGSVHNKRDMEKEYLYFHAKQYKWYIDNFGSSKAILFLVNQNYYFAIRHYLKKPSRERWKILKDVKIDGANVVGIIKYFLNRIIS